MASSSAITIIFSTVLSVLILKESFSKYDVLAIFLIITGSVLCMLLSKNGEKSYSESDLFGLFIETRSIVFICLSLLFILVGVRFSSSIKNQILSTYSKISSLHQKRTEQTRAALSHFKQP
mmetsp:Transcript_2977/g.5038  ORF Transcript_2977/g.5038 Transcript_2977/m.5038 type:complete len:121 (+) Transcript_2977:351-713(+)